MKANLLLLLVLGFIASSCLDVENEEPCFQPECVKEQLEKDIVIIQNYLDDNNLQAERHPSELFYIIHQETDSALANRGQELLVNYTGRFLDGKVFDTSVDSVAREAGIYNESRDYQPFKFTLGEGRVIQGWEIGFSLIRKGSTATLIIPSYLAYGPRGSGSIAPNTVLLFEVELVNIRY